MGIYYKKLRKTSYLDLNIENQLWKTMIIEGDSIIQEKFN